MNTSHDDPLKPFRWFAPVDLHSSTEGRWSVLAKATVGLLIGVLLFCYGCTTAGIVVCTITLIIGVVSLLSARARIAVSIFFARLGQLLGHGLGIVVLVPLYVIVFSLSNAWQWLTGSDPLQMYDDKLQSFWLESDAKRRKQQYVYAMFATERLRPGGRRLLPACIVLIAVVLGAELTLRCMGFGHPLLYVNDPQVGYYPAPNQHVTRYGGRVITNRFGMRSGNYTLEKPDGVLRILLIGDSTLYGGSYIDQEELYASLLEKHLRHPNKTSEPRGLSPRKALPQDKPGGSPAVLLDKSPDRSKLDCGKVEVFSIGVNAWGPFHKLGYVEKHGTFDADVAVVCMPIGDIYRLCYGLQVLPYFSVDRPPRCAIEEFVAHLAWRYKSGIAGAWTPEARREQGRRGIEAYVELARALRRRGCEVFFEILPSRTAGTTGDVSPEERRNVDQLCKALASEGFARVGYPVGLFRNQGAAEELYHDPCHLHQKGHRLYAEYLKRRMMRHSEHLGRWTQELVQAERLETDGEHIRR